MKLGFIGGGNMAAALIGGLLHKGYAARDICVADLNDTRRSLLQDSFGVLVEATAATCLKADTIVLAVKPQQVHALLTCLPKLDPGQLILSIAAGIRATDISRWLAGHPAVARAMPNTPALVGAGVAGLYALPAVSAEQRQQAASILAAVGHTIWMQDEAQLDAVTAISGSGPAYVFYFIEALEQAAVELGLPAETAHLLSVQTFLGAATLASKDPTPLPELRARVTSKGGTTERGLLELSAGGVKEIIVQAAWAAAARAREMGDIFGNDNP